MMLKKKLHPMVIVRPLIKSEGILDRTIHKIRIINISLLLANKENMTLYRTNHITESSNWIPSSNVN